MAGNYPDAPSRRFAYDSDGTVVCWTTREGTGWRQSTSGELTTLNNESEADYTFSYGWVVYLFPEDREGDGAFHAAEITSWEKGIGPVQSSVDTTNGIDGTWIQQIADLPNYTAVGTNWRTGITSMAVAGVRGLRFGLESSSFGTNMIRAIHVYGTISPGETPDRILYLDTENADAIFTKPIDYAEVPRGQTQQRTIKLKNNSAGKTINTIQITAEDLYLNAGGFYTFSTDDVSYQATLALGNLGPGATVPSLYVKQSVPDGEVLGLQSGRLRVSHASLT